MGEKRGGAASEQEGFVESLGTLKQEGNNVLLVGRETAGCHRAICDRLLGESATEPRYRLFVTADQEAVHTHSDERDVSTRTIDYSALEVAAGSANETMSDRTPLGTLGIEITDAIDALDDVADGLGPSELRVCVDSLVPLLEEHRTERVFRLLHVTTSRIAYVHGMGHFHLPLERDHEAVNLFEPMFDAVVEVRGSEGSYEQRWELQDQATPTEWLSFDSSH